MTVFQNIFCCFVLMVVSVRICDSAWQDNIKPKKYIHLGEEDMVRFLGNETVRDHFKLVLTHEEHMLVGARNMIYNLSLYDLSEKNRIEWYPDSKDESDCYMKGGSEEVCQNYIRILAKKNSKEFLVCGTNAYSPMCKSFRLENGVLEEENMYSGKGFSPFDPSLNSTAVFADEQLYVGTIADFSGLESMIYREPLRTEQYDLFTLNSPNFVSSFALGDFVYFFFRESAVEYLNCGKTLYSRVARVCRHDKGGPHKFRNKWTSFLKSRLNCSISGDFPFYFNEIQSTTDPIEGRYGGHATTLLYGVFTTPQNSIPGSAICAFTFQDIMDTFEGPFKGKKSVNANWLPVKVPEPRPGQCVKDSSTLPDVTLNFIKTHPLMDEAVPAFFGRPLLIRTSYHANGRFTSVAVDPQVRTPDGKQYDILFVGTDDGKVIKAINTKSADSFENVDPFIIDEIVVFPPSMAITSLKVISIQNRRRLLIVSGTKIVSISLFRCGTNKITSCNDCVGLQDPYCGWDRFNRKCRVVTTLSKDLIQSVTTGNHTNCTKEKPSHAPSVGRESSKTKDGRDLDHINGREHSVDGDDGEAGDNANAPTTQSVPLQFTAETLAIAVASAAIGALILGFITGFFCGKKCNKEEENQLYAVTDYEYYDQRQNANSRLTSDLQEEVTYAEPVLVPQSLNKPVNMVLQMSPKATLKSMQQQQNLQNPGIGNNLGNLIGPPNLENPNPLGFNIGMPPPQGNGGNGGQDIPLHYTPESYSTHGTLRSSEKFGTRGRGDPRRDFDHRMNDGYATTRSVKKVYL